MSLENEIYSDVLLGRPTGIEVIKKQDGYQIICIDKETGSTTGMDIPKEGYEALKQHFINTQS